MEMTNLLWSFLSQFGAGRRRKMLIRLKVLLCVEVCKSACREFAPSVNNLPRRTARVNGQHASMRKKVSEIEKVRRFLNYPCIRTR